jgi:hypothetical protein
MNEIQERRDRGMEVATSHADAVTEGWRYYAGRALVNYLRCHDKPFLTQDLIEWARTDGLPEPPTKKAWGTVVTGAARRHIILIDSYTKEGTYNANMKPLWKATEEFKMREPGDEEDIDTEWPDGPDGPFIRGGIDRPVEVAATNAPEVFPEDPEQAPPRMPPAPTPLPPNAPPAPEQGPGQWSLF